MVQWCHGSPGILPTLVKWYKITKNDTYLQQAHMAHHFIASHGLLKKGYGICHGVAGNAMMFIKLLQVTSHQPQYQAMYEQHLQKFATFMLQDQHKLVSVPDNPCSLFEGIAGAVIVLHQIRQVLQSKSPLCEHFPAFDYL